MAGPSTLQYNLKRCAMEGALLGEIKVLVRGGGDLASGVVYRLHRTGMPAIVLELPAPMVIRRAVSFASALSDGAIQVEGVVGRRANSLGQALRILGQGEVPVMVDPDANTIRQWHPDVVVDAILAKRNVGTRITDAPIVIGLGPGFVAGVDVHAVVETKRGHYLGRVILEGSAAADTGVPGEIMGYASQRVLRAPRSGMFVGRRQIGQQIKAGETVAEVDGEPVTARIDGVLRGLLANNRPVVEGMKVGDVDPRGIRDHCFTISDKALAIGGGVLEAVLLLKHACPRDA
jgi:xanthine dehydrogenase accessory factor